MTLAAAIMKMTKKMPTPSKLSHSFNKLNSFSVNNRNIVIVSPSSLNLRMKQIA